MFFKERMCNTAPTTMTRKNKNTDECNKREHFFVQSKHCFAASAAVFNAIKEKNETSFIGLSIYQNNKNYYTGIY